MLHPCRHGVRVENFIPVLGKHGLELLLTTVSTVSAVKTCQNAPDRTNMQSHLCEMEIPVYGDCEIDNFNHFFIQCRSNLLVLLNRYLENYPSRNSIVQCNVM